MIRSLF